MAQTFVVANRHAPEECELMEAGLAHLPAHLKGQSFYCTCPYGEHGYYMILEGSSAEEVIAGLPSEIRKGTRALPVEVMTLPD